MSQIQSFESPNFSILAHDAEASSAAAALQHEAQGAMATRSGAGGSLAFASAITRVSAEYKESLPELKITASEKPHSSAVSEKRLSAMSAVEKSNLLETTFEKISKTTHHSQMSEQQFDDAVRLLDSNGIPGVRLSPNEEAAAHFVEGHFHDLMKSDRYTAKTIDDITFKNHTIEVMYPNMLAGLPEIVKGVVGIAAFVPTVPATCGFSLLGVAAGIGYIGLGAMKIAEHRAEKRFDGALISELK